MLLTGRGKVDLLTSEDMADWARFLLVLTFASMSNRGRRTPYVGVPFSRALLTLVTVLIFGVAGITEALRFERKPRPGEDVNFWK